MSSLMINLLQILNNVGLKSHSKMNTNRVYPATLLCNNIFVYHIILALKYWTILCSDCIHCFGMKRIPGGHILKLF